MLQWGKCFTSIKIKESGIKYTTCLSQKQIPSSEIFRGCKVYGPFRAILTMDITALDFVQLVKNTTQIKGGIIDHVYVKFGISTFEKTEINIRSVYYSDHGAIQMAFPELQFC